MRQKSAATGRRVLKVRRGARDTVSRQIQGDAKRNTDSCVICTSKVNSFETT